MTPLSWRDEIGPPLRAHFRLATHSHSPFGSAADETVPCLVVCVVPNVPRNFGSPTRSMDEAARSTRAFWIVRAARRGFRSLAAFRGSFAPESYAESFGFQWNRFRQTQLDSHSGHSVSRERFLTATGWEPESLAGKTVLDAGCGAGRFAEIALSCGATVFAVDYSRARSKRAGEFSVASQPARHAGEHLFASLSRRVALMPSIAWACCNTLPTRGGPFWPFRDT